MACRETSSHAGGDCGDFVALSWSFVVRLDDGALLLGEFGSARKCARVDAARFSLFNHLQRVEIAHDGIALGEVFRLLPRFGFVVGLFAPVSEEIE